MSDAGPSDQKPEAGDAPKTLKIKIQGTGMPELTIQVKRTAKLAKVFGAYADRAGKQLNDLAFLFDGQRISESTKISDLDIDDDDEEITFDVMTQQVGGSA